MRESITAPDSKEAPWYADMPLWQQTLICLCSLAVLCWTFAADAWDDRRYAHSR